MEARSLVLWIPRKHFCIHWNQTMFQNYGLTGPFGPAFYESPFQLYQTRHFIYKGWHGSCWKGYI